MVLTDSKLFAVGGAPGLSRAERVKTLCEEARRLESAGEFERAAALFADRWAAVGGRPITAGLDRHTAAELLLRAGVLTGHLGSSQKLAGTQECAKDLISEARGIFVALGEEARAFECDALMAVCYWREHGNEEALALATTVLIACEPGADALLIAANVKGLALWALGQDSPEKTAEGLSFLEGMEETFGASERHAQRVSYHNTLALLYKQAGRPKDALLNYLRSSEQLERAGNRRHLARIENNLASLFSEGGQHAEAHAHVERARRIALETGDRGYTGQVEDTRANVLIREGKYAHAVEAAREAVCILREGDEYGLQIEALTTLGTALARNGEHIESILTFSRAREMALNHLGAKAGADIMRRLMLENLSGLALEAGMKFDEAVLQFEAALIAPALQLEGGHITAAAMRIGISYKRLAAMLDGRHYELLSARTPVKPRLRSYTGPGGRGGGGKGKLVRMPKK